MQCQWQTWRKTVRTVPMGVGSLPATVAGRRGFFWSDDWLLREGREGDPRAPPPTSVTAIPPRLSLGGGGGEEGGLVTPTETNVHRDALCFMAKTWARHKTTETVLNNGWRLAVGGWRLVAVGGWRLAVGGP